jgi:hypothetical protein
MRYPRGPIESRNKHMMTCSFARRMLAPAIVAVFAAGCQVTSMPPLASAEARLLAAGYVKQSGYPQPSTGAGIYEARYTCVPPACAARGDVSYFSNVTSNPSSVPLEVRLRSGAIAPGSHRTNLHAAAQRTAEQDGRPPRRYLTARPFNENGAVGVVSTSVRASAMTGRPRYSHSRLTVSGDRLRIIVSGGDTDTQARRGLILGKE